MILVITLFVCSALTAAGVYWIKYSLRSKALKTAGSLYHTRVAFSKKREKLLRKQAKELEEGILEANKWIVKQGYAECSDASVRAWYRERGYDVVVEHGTPRIRLPPLSNKEMSDLITGKTEETQ